MADKNTSLSGDNGGFDIIGDIHGQYDALEALLGRLGYAKSGGVWRHSERKAVFVGDLIDRGPQQRKVTDTVRAMTENGSAYCILGNHEFNAISYFTKDKDGQPLRKLNTSHEDPHLGFLREVGIIPLCMPNISLGLELCLCGLKQKGFALFMPAVMKKPWIFYGKTG